MVGGTNALELEQVLRFPFRGDEWQNRLAVGVGLLLASLFVPFVPAVFVYGYLVRIMRAAIERGELELQAWDDWGGLFREGLKALVVGFTYLLPGLLILMAGTCLYCGTAMVLPFATDGGGPTGGPEDLFALWFLVVFVIFFASLAFGSLLALLGAIPLPVAAANLAAEKRLGAAYRLRHIARSMAVNPMGYFAAWVVFLGLMAILYLFMAVAYYTLVLACFIPILIIPPSFYALLVASGQFGLAYRESQSLLEAG